MFYELVSRRFVSQKQLLKRRNMPPLKLFCSSVSAAQSLGLSLRENTSLQYLLWATLFHPEWGLVYFNSGGRLLFYDYYCDPPWETLPSGGSVEQKAKHFTSLPAAVMESERLRRKQSRAAITLRSWRSVILSSNLGSQQRENPLGSQKTHQERHRHELLIKVTANNLSLHDDTTLYSWIHEK